MGKTDGAIPNPKRDTAIIRARRKFYKEFPWSFLKKKTTITFTSGVATFPVDYDTTFEPRIYSYVGNVKTEYKLVPLDNVSAYTTACPVFAIDVEGGQFTSNTDGTPEITYPILVSDTLSDSFAEPTSDISAIVALSVGYFWLASERNAGNFDRFNAVYKEELARLVREDRLKSPVRYAQIDTTDYGYSE